MDALQRREGHPVHAPPSPTHQVVVFDRYGPPDVLRVIDQPLPHAAAGELRVRVRAAGVQPMDLAVRNGGASAASPSFPRRLGNEFAGIVDQVGNDVEGFSIGDEVLGWATSQCYAEVLTVPAAQVVFKPPSMTWAVAGAMSASGQTAHAALKQLRVSAGETVLIHAAAGGVGSMAVQLARDWNARVIGTASADNHDYLRSLGAEPVLYGEGLADRVRALAPRGVDAALDAVGGEALDVSLALGVDHNRIGTLVAFDRAASLGVVGIHSRRSRDRLAELVTMYDEGRLRPHVREMFPLSRAADAHRVVERGHGRGKVVLMVYEANGTWWS